MIEKRLVQENKIVLDKIADNNHSRDDHNNLNN